MPWKTDMQPIKNGVQEIYVYNTDNPNKRHLAYKIYKTRKLIEFYPQDSSIVKKLDIQGFSYLPDEFSEGGYIKSGTEYYLLKKLAGHKVSKVIISKKKQNSFRKHGETYTVVINYDSFSLFRKRLSSISNEAKFDRSLTADETFHKLFPRKFPKVNTGVKRRAAKVVNNLDEEIIHHFNSEEVNNLVDFIELILKKKKFKSAISRRNLFKKAKIKVDEVAITDIISQFEELLSKKSSEKIWADFLKKNLFLLDSRYIDAIPELNVKLATSRKVDFGLVDSQGYLDIFEIKKPDTPLLAKNTDRGNYYWSTDAVKAIMQAEKYLNNAERKSDSLAADIKDEKGIDVKVIRPRVLLIMGHRKQLDNDNKDKDFRVLQDSLKNVAVVPYDDLLTRLKNQKNKVLIL